MPEGPEIALNVDLFLKPALRGKDLVDVEMISGKYLKKKPNNFTAFEKGLPARVTHVDKKGKFAWFELDNGWIVGIGFGMSGRLTEDPDNPHNRIRLEIGKKGDELYYADMRNFGNWYFWNDRKDLEKKLNELGIDFMRRQNVSKKEVVETFRQFDHWEISKALMSQRVLAGVGNYLRAETLYASKIYPYAKIANLTDANIYDLYKKTVIWGNKAYKFQLDSFKKGKPYEDFQEKMKIYGKKTDPTGKPITRSPDTRTTWWVKSVQTIGKPKGKTLKITPKVKKRTS